MDGLSEGDSLSRMAGDPAPPRPHSELRRVTVCEHDERLEVKSVRGIGFSWRCGCGARGQVWKSRPAAIADKQAHERTHEAGLPGD